MEATARVAAVVEECPSEAIGLVSAVAGIPLQRVLRPSAGAACCRAASLQVAAQTMPESAVTSLAVHLALILLLFADRCLYALGRS